MRLFAAILVGLVLTVPADAGIYSPNEPFLFELDADGLAKAIQYSGGYDSILLDVREVARMPQTPADPPNTRRQEYLDRVKERQGKGVASLTDDELAGLTADLIRLNRNEEALNILQPLARDPRRGGFLAYAHLARARAGQGEWRDAYERQQMALTGFDFPTSFRGISRPQLVWLRHVEKDYYLPLLAQRALEAGRGRPTERREAPDALFPSVLPPRRSDNPVQFVGADSKYTAGSIAEAERQKLPPDALAIVQQLVLWFPYDARLYWLLAELYNAQGDVPTAVGIMNSCRDSMAYANPTMMEHRQFLRAAADAMSARVREQEAADAAQAAQVERDYQKRFWWIVAIGVALGLVLLYYQGREVVRRVRRRWGA